MPAWSGWIALAVSAWIVASCVLGLMIGRVIASANPATESGRNEQRVPQPVEPARPRRRVLIVDDDAPLRSLLHATLASDEFEVREAYSAEHALEVMRFWPPEIVVLDVNLPGLDGLTLCAELARSEEHRDAAVILLTGEQISETTARMAGAKAVMRKPFSPLELLDVIARVVDRHEFVSGVRRSNEEQLLMYARDLASIAQAERTQRQLLQEAYRQTAIALADAVDVRDRATGLHAKRVQRYALGLVEAVDVSLLSDPSLEYGFLLHDVGKIGISDHVLLKQGPLTDEERDLVQTHPLIGAQILHDVALLKGAGLDVVRHHHERWDGAGYPDRLTADQIPLGARVFAVADTLDAMTSDRPYRTALGWGEAVEEILAQSGRQFDPAVVQAFVAVEDELRSVYEDLRLVA